MTLPTTLDGVQSQVDELSTALRRALLNGIIATQVTLSLDEAEDGLPGDIVVVDSSIEAPPNAPIVRKAITANLTDAQSVLGILLEPTTRGRSAYCATIGVIQPSITGLVADDPSPVRVNMSTGRCERVVELSAGDFPIGSADASGNLILGITSTPGNISPSVGGDVLGPLTSATVVRLTGDGESGQVEVVGALAGSVAETTPMKLGATVVNFPTDANYTAAPTEYTNPVLRLTSSVSLSTTRNLVLPGVIGALYVIQNDTTGGQPISVTAATGTGISIASAGRQWVMFDGTNFVALSGSSLALLNSLGVLIPSEPLTQIEPSLVVINAGADGKNHLKVNTFIDPRDKPYYWRTVTALVGSLATFSAENPIGSFASAANFRQNDGVMIMGAGANQNYTTPAAPILDASHAIAGSVLVANVEMQYKVVACSNKLGWSAASSLATTGVVVDGVMGPRTAARIKQVTVAYGGGNLPGYAAGVIPNVPSTIDNFQVANSINSLVLIWQQTNKVENGLYSVTAMSGTTCTLTRTTSWTTTPPGAGGGAAIFGDGFYVQRGNVYASQKFRINTNITTIGVDQIGIVPMPYVDVRPYYTTVDVATTKNITLSGVPIPADLDGYTAVAGTTTVLVKNQTVASQNGLWTVQNAGWTRIPAFDTVGELLKGLVVYVRYGDTLPIWVANANNGAMYVQTNQPATINVSDITYDRETIVYFLFYARTGNSAAFKFIGATNANPYWQTPTTPCDPFFRDFSAVLAPGSGYLQTTPEPSSSQPDFLLTRIDGISGNNVTLHDAPTTSVTGTGKSGIVKQCNDLALEDAMASFSAVGQSGGGMIVIPPGFSAFFKNITIRKGLRIIGTGTGEHSTNIAFGPGGGMRVMHHTHAIDQFTPGEGSKGDGASIESLYMTPIEETLPGGGGMHSTNDGPLEMFGRPPEHGVWFVAQAQCTTDKLAISGGIGAHFYICGTDVSQSNANNCDFQAPRSGAPGGRGFWIQGANANGCLISNPEVNGAQGYGYYNASFLGSTIFRPLCEIADGATYYQASGSIIDAYMENSNGVIVILAGEFNATLGSFNNFHPLSNNTAARIRTVGSGNYQTAFTIATTNGSLISQYGDTVNDRQLRSFITDSYYSGLKAAFYETIDPNLADGAISWYWQTSTLVPFRIMGANPTGSGILRVPRGLELTTSNEGTLRRWFKMSNGPPTEIGWYQVGDFYGDIVTGGAGGANNRFGYTITAEFGIGSTFSSGLAVRVGDKITVGGATTYVVEKIIDGLAEGAVDRVVGVTNEVGGVLGASGPADPGSNHRVDSGTARLYRLANNGAGTGTTSRIQVLAHPSPPWTGITANAGTPGSPTVIGNTSPWTGKSAALNADRFLYFSGVSALPGDFHVHVRSNNSGDFDEYIYDADQTTLLAVLPAGSVNSIRAQYDGANWKIQYAPSTVFRRVSTRAAIDAIPPLMRYQGNVVVVDEDGGSRWMFSSSSTASDSTGNMVRTPTVAGSGLQAGRWIRIDATMDMKLAVGFATADNAVLFTVPTFATAPFATGIRLAVLSSTWEITSDWTGGTLSAIGLSSSSAKASTAGDILGGATGDQAVNLTAAALFDGTAGTKVGQPRTVLVAGDTIKFNRIASAFIAGAGFGHIRLGVLT